MSDTPVVSFILFMASSYVVILRSCSSPDRTAFCSTEGQENTFAYLFASEIIIAIWHKKQ